MGSGIKLGKVLDPMGLWSEEDTSRQDEASAIYRRMAQELDKLDIPDIEKQKIALQLPEVVGTLQAEQLGQSAVSGISADRQAVEGQRSALSQLQELANKGFSEEDRAAMRTLSRQVGADEQARQASILNEMAQRGVGGSGQELAARLASSQASTGRAAEASDRLAMNQAEARRAALNQLGQQSSQLRAQDYGEKSEAAKARDTINQFNALQRAQTNQYNLGQKQSTADQQAAIKNQQEMYNKGLYQQQFQNKLAKATGQQAAQGNLAQNLTQTSASLAQAEQAKRQGIMGLGATAAMAFSDIRVKENIKPASTESGDLKELLDNITPAEYDYKDEVGGAPNQIGVMAQDLEKSKVGKQYVTEAPDGTKMVDYGRMAPMFLATLKDLSDRLDRFETGDQKSVGEIKESDMENPIGRNYGKGGLGDKLMITDPSLMSESQLRNVNDVYVNPPTYNEQKNMTASGNIKKSDIDYSKLISSGLSELSKIDTAPDVPKMNFQNPAEAALAKLRQYADGGKGEPSEMYSDGTRYDEALDEGELELNPEAQDELLEALRGKISPSDFEEGRIIEGESYSGDLLPDRINSGESVNTVKMQDRNKEMLREGHQAKEELAGLRKLLQLVGKK